MSIFGRKQDPSTSRRAGDEAGAGARGADAASRATSAASTSPAASHLGPECRVDGDIRGAGHLELEGRLEGSIELDGDVVVGKLGKASASIRGRRIVIHGHLEGDATGAERVEVGATGHVEGDIRAPSVLFQEGAFFEGNVEMRRSAKKAAEESSDDDGPAGS